MFIACPSALDHASIHWSMNCFHWVARSGVIGVCAKRRAHCSSPWFSTGRQKAVGSVGGGGACPTMRVQAAADSSNCLRHRSSSGLTVEASAIVSSYERGASQLETFGQQCSDAPRPAISEM